MVKKFSLLIILLALLTGLTLPGLTLPELTPPELAVQDVEFKASAPSEVAVGEQFRLTYSVNKQAGNLRLPSIDKFQLVSGPSTSSSSSVQIINGQMAQTFSATYTYILSATEAGEFNIDPATITVDSEQYSSNSLTINVVPDSEGRTATPQSTPSRPQTGGEAIRGEEEIFIRILLDKNEVYVGEPVVATLKLYTKLDLTGYDNVVMPTFTGFFQQELQVPALRNLTREVINGEIYNTGIFRQILLYPQRSGEIDPGTFKLNATVRQRIQGTSRSVFDDFFGSFETRRIPLESPPAKIRVKPLSEPRPNDFTGAVGDFTIRTELPGSGYRSNEAMSMRVIISGEGNLSLLSKPKIDFPPGFEIFDPAVTENINTGINGQRGTIVYDYIIIPRTEGSFLIPPVRFTYFNPAQQRYLTAEAPEIAMDVERGTESQPGVIAGGTRESLRILGSDIRFIITSGTILQLPPADPFTNFSYYLWFIIPALLFIVTLVIQRKKIKERADLSLLRRKRAAKMARRRLKTAGVYLRSNNSQLYFEEILRAYNEYLSDKLLIPISELNMDNVRSSLNNRGLKNDLIEKITNIISTLEFARYAPPSATPDMKSVYDQAIRIITEIEQSLKK